MATKKQIESSIELIGPERATQILDTMGTNRRLSSGVVGKYANLMKQGLWRNDGSPIRIATNGKLVDGQHRLFAVIESETTQEFVVQNNVPEDSFVTMDTGKPRSFSDIITIEFPDQPSVHLAASLTQLLFRWDQGMRSAALATGGNRSGGAVPNSLLLGYFREHRDAISLAARVGHRVLNGLYGFSPTSTGALHVLTSRLDDSEEDVADFFDRLQNGQDLSDGDPIYTLRRYGENVFRTSQNSRSRIPNDFALAYLIKGWNAYRDGVELHQLKFRKGGAKPEAFPEPR